MRGDEVKEKIKQAGFTLKDVAEKMGVSPQALQNTLKTEDIKTGVLKSIATAINKNVYFFLEDILNEEKNHDLHSDFTTAPLITQYAHGSYLKSFFYMMVEREVIQKNPFFGIKKLRHDIGKNIAFNQNEKVKLAETLKDANEHLYHFVQFMYHCFLRRSEIIRVKVGDIDWINRTIRVNSEDTKNRRQESVAIPSGLEPILEEMNLKNLPSDLYIFSHNLKPGRYMLVKADHITAWHKQILKSLGISEGKTLYSWKHTGVVDYYNAIRDPYPIMQQLRHHSLSITMVYLKSLGLQPNSLIRNAELKL